MRVFKLSSSWAFNPSKIDCNNATPGVEHRALAFQSLVVKAEPEAQ